MQINGQSDHFRLIPFSSAFDALFSYQYKLLVFVSTLSCMINSKHTISPFVSTEITNLDNSYVTENRENLELLP